MKSKPFSCIVFSVPRAGTHLVMRTLELLGLKEYHVDWTCDTNVFNIPKRGCYCFGGHLPSEYCEQLTERGLKAIYIIRDLRDVAVSLTHFMERVKTHPYHPFFMKLDGWNERLKYVIKGVSVKEVPEILRKFTFPSLRWRYCSTAGWSISRDVYSTRFESLVGSKGGGDDTTQELVIRQISDHLNIELSAKAIKKCQKKIWGSRKNQYAENIRRGLIGDWKLIFKPEHKDLAKKEFGDILIDERYEQDLDW